MLDTSQEPSGANTTSNNAAASIPQDVLATSRDALPSLSIQIGPRDRRCRWWAKIIRAADLALPLPVAIGGAGSLRQAYARSGDEELFPGDFVIEGEENHHRKQRGWTYWLCGLDSRGREISVRTGQFADIKPRLKEAGIAQSLLAGSGDIAAAVRIIHAVRAGIDVRVPSKPEGNTPIAA